MTPLFIAINLCLLNFYDAFPNIEKYSGTISIFTSILSSLIGAFISYLFAKANFEASKRSVQELLSRTEIQELDSASKLLRDGYYSHSILETFKVFETHIFKKLTEKGIRAPIHKFNELLELAIKHGIVKQTYIPSINDFRQMRNVAAHLDSDYTKEQAENVLHFVKEFLIRNS